MKLFSRFRRVPGISLTFEVDCDERLGRVMQDKTPVFEALADGIRGPVHLAD